MQSGVTMTIICGEQGWFRSLIRWISKSLTFFPASFLQISFKAIHWPGSFIITAWITIFLWINKRFSWINSHFSWIDLGKQTYLSVISAHRMPKRLPPLPAACVAAAVGVAAAGAAVVRCSEVGEILDYQWSPQKWSVLSIWPSS